MKLELVLATEARIICYQCQEDIIWKCGHIEVFIVEQASLLRLRVTELFSLGHIGDYISHVLRRHHDLIVLSRIVGKDEAVAAYSSLCEFCTDQPVRVKRKQIWLLCVPTHFDDLTGATDTWVSRTGPVFETEGVWRGVKRAWCTNLPWTANFGIAADSCRPLVIFIAVVEALIDTFVLALGTRLVILAPDCVQASSKGVAGAFITILDWSATKLPTMAASASAEKDEKRKLNHL